MTRNDFDVLVIGLGPVGDVMAGLSAAAGLSVVAVDRETTHHALPRAAVFDAEIMRIFQALGVAERIAPFCREPDRYQFLTADRQVLLDFDLSEPSDVSGWAHSYAMHQPAVEAILRARLAELGVDVRLGRSFVSLTQDHAGVAAMFHGPSGHETIRARYVVGCDGGASPVRVAAGLPLFDYQFDEPWLVVDALIEGEDRPPVVCEQLCDPRRPVTHLAMSPPRYRWEFMLKPDEDPQAFAGDESLRALLKPWVDLDDITIERRAIYRFHGLVAERWRAGRVLIAGDAAHQMPPFAGQGLCSGVRDANNLAWKLQAVVRNGAPDAFLDSYQEEREPHVRAVIETAIAMGRVVCLQDPQAAATRDAEMLARKAQGVQDVSTAYPDLRGGCLTDSPDAGALFPQLRAEGRRLDDALGPGAWLIGRDLPAFIPAGLRRIDLDSPSVSAFRFGLAGWLTEREAQAVLVRPDRHVFGTGQPASLVAAWRAKLEQPVAA